MALAFALEHGAKITKLDSSGNSSMLGFLPHIGTRSLDTGKMGRTSSFRMNEHSSQFPTLSHLHIKEVSKGAQKLNQILRACSNGLNFDGYSIEIGKELLKGAMDLEESLRMLVNLQEASEHMVSPQRKNRIRLLEEDEDDEDGTAKIPHQQKQVDRPRFSFDKPSRNVTKTDPKQSLMALTYPSEAPGFSGKQAVNNSNLVSHKRTVSCGPDFGARAGFSELKHQKSSSKSKPEKGRIPNVIAKLMGLEELPQAVESKSAPKESISKQKEEMVSKKIAHASTKNAVSKTKDTENIAPLAIEKKLTQSNNVRATKPSSSTSEFRDPQATQNAIPELEAPDGRLLWKAQQSDTGQLYKFTGSQNDFQEMRRQDNAKQRGQISMERGETKQPVLKDEMQKHKSPEAANTIGGKESTLQEEKRNGNRIPPSSQKMPKYDHGMHQQQPLQKSELQEDRNQTEKKEEQHVKQKFKFRKQKGIEANPKDPSKSTHDATGLQKKQQYTNQEVPNKRSSREVSDGRPLKGLPNSKSLEALSTEGSSTKWNVNSMDGNSNQNASRRELGSETHNTKGSIQPVTGEKPVHFPATRRKEDQMKVHTSETPRTIDEVLTRRNGTRRNSARPLKHQILILQEMKQKRLEKISSSKVKEQKRSSRSREKEVQNFTPKESEAITKSLNGLVRLENKGEQAPSFNSSEEDELQRESITQFPTPDGSCQSKASMLSTVPIDCQDQVPVDCQDQAPVVIKDRELKSLKTASSPLNGADGGNTEISYLSQHENKEISTQGMQELLTETEINLKKILIKSQLFLNTAEALFKLNVPFDVLPVTDYNSQDEDSNLILDCGYEIMKRKGRRQELTLHPCLNVSIISVKVTSLDDLVKQLYKDFEKLKSYVRNGCDEYNEAEYLHKMLERDVQNTDPDVNGMWDLGWSKMMFAILEKDDLIREVERYLLNGLIDELVKDLLHLSVFI